MQDFRLGQKPVYESLEAPPRPSAAPTAPPQHKQPGPRCLSPESVWPPQIPRHRVIVEVSSHHLCRLGRLSGQSGTARIQHPAEAASAGRRGERGIGTPAGPCHLWPLRPAYAPVNASAQTFRSFPHDSGSGRLATPFLYDSFIHYATPVFTSAPGETACPTTKDQCFARLWSRPSACAFLTFRSAAQSDTSSTRQRANACRVRAFHRWSESGCSGRAARV
jgi:hypothetical protein